MIPVVTLRDSYKEYKNTVANPIEPKTYFKITGDLFKFMMEKVIHGSHDVELGGGQSLGTIGIRGSKNKKKKPDWKNTYLLWNRDPEAKKNREYIYHLNDHSNGVTYYFYWWTTGMKIGFKRVYSFKSAKDNRRELVKLAFEGHEWILKTKKDYQDA